MSNQKAKMVEERRMQQLLQRKTEKDERSGEMSEKLIEKSTPRGQRTYSLSAVRQPSSNREGSHNTRNMAVNEDYDVELAIASKMHAIESKMKRAADSKMHRQRSMQ
mmetsp:Transcript_3922/g.4662  ORF Transcript_3922/g.4662 Transcript_3922/m.4662 type:complete len:107 (+) Transcript_3922:885-1205(+)